MVKRKKRVTIKQRRGKRRYTRRNKRGGQPTAESIDNIKQQIDFVQQHSEEFKEIGVNPDNFVDMMQTVLQYIEEQHEFPPFIKKESDLGSVEVLSTQLNMIKDKIEEDKSKAYEGGANEDEDPDEDKDEEDKSRAYEGGANEDEGEDKEEVEDKEEDEE